MSAVAVRILVVDDEPPIRRLLRTGLSSQGYDVLEAGTGREADQLLASAPELVILDLGLPDVAGQDLLRRWRAEGNDVPVLILSSRTDEAGIVEALELGADDYLTKPFGVKELVARIRNALRHRLQAQGERALFQSGDLSVDLVRRIVRLRGEPISLSPREYEALRVLVQHAGKVLTHRFMIRQVWGGAVDVQNLRVLVRQLRQKIEPDPERPRHILTETGVGYRLGMPD
jgi:two-component system KDP operon response regulator KdpE